MKTKQELTDILDFVAEYASYLLGSGVHTSRVIRNAQRIGTSQGVDIQLSSFQKSIIITVHDERSGEVVTRVVKIPALPISFERNSDLSALSWDAVDEHLSLTDLRDRYGELIAKPRMDPIFVLLTVGLANASFCRLFGGDWTAEVAIATSPLFLVPGVPLINGVIDIVEGHILIGCSRLINALLLIVCIAVGLSATLMIVKNSLL